jgi:prevent-host-death family protein
VKNMTEVGIRALKQNASAVVAEAAAGAVITITDHGRPVARLTPIPTGALDGLVSSGRARPARRALRDLPAPEPGPALTPTLQEMRDADRY